MIVLILENIYFKFIKNTPTGPKDVCEGNTCVAK